MSEREDMRAELPGEVVETYRQPDPREVVEGGSDCYKSGSAP